VASPYFAACVDPPLNYFIAAVYRCLVKYCSEYHSLRQHYMDAWRLSHCITTVKNWQ